MKERQIQSTHSLGRQIRSFGLNPNDWVVRWSNSFSAVQLTHRENTELRLVGETMGPLQTLHLKSLRLYSI